MVDKSQLSKELEEQIQGVASEVYIHIEDKLTDLISKAIDIRADKNTPSDHNDDLKILNKRYQDSQTKLDQQEQKLAAQQQASSTEIAALKTQLQNHIADIEAKKQNFQVELTQNSINYTETIEQLEQRLAEAEQSLKAKKSVPNKPAESGGQLKERLFAKIQKLKDQKSEISSLKGQVLVLTEQEQKLLQQVKTLTAHAETHDEALKTELASSQEKFVEQEQNLSTQEKQIQLLTEQLSAAKSNLRESAKQAELTFNDKINTQQKKYAALNEQLNAEKISKIDLQKELTHQKKTLDTQLEHSKKLEQELTAFKQQEGKLKEQITLEQEKVKTVQEQLVASEKAMNAEQKVIEDIALENIKIYEAKITELTKAKEKSIYKSTNLEKTNAELFEQLIAEEDKNKHQQQEVLVLKEAVKVANESQENILQRFNSGREKQEQNDNKARETIKVLRDENLGLISEHEEESESLSQKINELEVSLTEYRLKFEYAQKQLSK